MFNCSKCGICCKHIDLVDELKQFDKGDGTCIHLVNNLCDIYKTRPDICRVDFMYETKYSSQYSKEEFYKINEAVCESLKQMYREE